MAFPPAEVKIPTDIGNIIIVLKDAVATDESAAYQSIHYDVIVKYSNGTIIHQRGNLAPHLSSGQITALQSFMADMRTKAEEELLPS